MFESTGTPYSFKEQPTVDAAKEMLQSLRALVPNSGNISRLQEECDLLCLALVHYETGSCWVSSFGEQILNLDLEPKARELTAEVSRRIGP